MEVASDDLSFKAEPVPVPEALESPGLLLSTPVLATLGQTKSQATLWPRTLVAWCLSYLWELVPPPICEMGPVCPQSVHLSHTHPGQWPPRIPVLVSLEEQGTGRWIGTGGRAPCLAGLGDTWLWC